MLPRTCISADRFLADAAAGRTAAEAFTANTTYYQQGIFKAMTLRTPVVLTAPSAKVGAQMRFIDGYEGNRLCFFAVIEALNRGNVSITSQSSETFALVLNPKHIAGAEPLTVSGKARAAVLGGIAQAPLTISTTGSVEVLGVLNSGDITVTNSNNVFIADVKNSGKVSIIFKLSPSGPRV